MTEKNNLVKLNEKINELTEVVNKFEIADSKITNGIAALSTRLTTEDTKFHCITPSKLNEMLADMPVINKGMRALGKNDTQMTRKLFTMSMLTPAGNVYRQLKQVLAQIEKVRMALHDNIYRHKENIIKLKEYKRQLEEEDLSEYKRNLIEIKIEKIVTGMADSTIYIEAAIKELGFLQKTYKEILKNNNISEDWDEKDMEEAEIKYAVTHMFRLCYRDLISAGRINPATMEGFEGIGINPIVAIHETQKHINAYNNKKPEETDYDFFMDWLDEMYEKYKDEYKKALRRTGIDTILHDDFVYKKYTEENSEES